jgi:indolepyruvate ferredoxin oxidoreductase
MSMPALTRALEAEGIQRIIVTTDKPEKYPRDSRWAPGVELWHRDRLDEAQRVLRETPGVTVLIHDQMCAAELRRQRKRGKMPDPTTRVFINTAVCEGCGDCGVKSNCLSVHPIETEFGRKTQIHQSSCNKDYSCLLGDCPAFITVTPKTSAGDHEPRTRPAPSALGARFSDEALPEPVMRVSSTCNIYMMGIGGTGVVTINQVLGTAALLDGRYVDGLDQTGLSQKGGSVVSHLKISAQPSQGSNRIGVGEADCYLAFDILTATTPQNLSRADAGRTVAVVSTSQLPTGSMVASPELRFPSGDSLTAGINQRTNAGANVFLDAIELAETYFGDHLAANTILLGAAYQSGLLPISAEAIERAIGLNGVAVRMNTAAFRLGRHLVARPEATRTRTPDMAAVPAVPAVARKLLAAADARFPLAGELRRLLEIRVPELVAYQNRAYARQYLDFVDRVRRAEQAAMPGETRLSEAVARYLFKLMAYKDEYEVARLHRSSGLDQTLMQQFGADANVRYHLHPPFLRALGWRKKIAFGSWFSAVYWLLARMKVLRGTRFDVFGYASIRQVERALIGEYRALVERELSQLSPATYERAVALAQLPDMIRGYEQIKLANVQRFQEAARELRSAG